MGRWVDRDNEDRNPEGFTRIGYDADEGKYYYSDAQGRTWAGEEGNRYGTLRPVRHPNADPTTTPTSPTSPSIAAQSATIPVPSSSVVTDHDTNLKRLHSDAIRAMLPFALLIFLVLFLLFRFVNLPFTQDHDHSMSKDSDTNSKMQVHCAEGHVALQVQKGDSCWDIAERSGLGVGELLGVGGNEGVECERLRVGQWICVPV